MLFNSIEFAVFLPIVFLLYWFVTESRLKLQNLLLLSASYIFYGWWDWRFLSLIIFSSFVDYYVGLALLRTNDKVRRKTLLWCSILVNIGFLGFFKYYNFFVDSFIDAFKLLGADLDPSRMNIILPVGISFYTFQTMSYTIDVYNRKLQPNKNIIAFFAFVSFFPQLVAGPIERATNLLPQFYKKRKFDYASAVDGLRQILWGLFKKIVIADNCAQIANEIFNNSDAYSGSTLLLGAFFFAFQIYGDFSGYSDIAIGTARLFGFNLMKNFNFPYFSRDIGEFWRRWHISLSSWFRDYVYIPLGGSKGGNWMKIRNIFIIFVVSGFWHGANWTFIAWGFINALYFLPLMLLKRNRVNSGDIAPGRMLPSMRDFINIVFTFLLTLIAWVFFRAANLEHAFNYLATIFSPSFFTLPQFNAEIIYVVQILILITFFVIIEWSGRMNEFAIAKLGFHKKRWFRLSYYFGIVFLIILFLGKEQQFIYFQF